MSQKGPNRERRGRPGVWNCQPKQGGTPVTSRSATNDAACKGLILGGVCSEVRFFFSLVSTTANLVAWTLAHVESGRTWSRLVQRWLEMTGEQGRDWGQRLQKPGTNPSHRIHKLINEFSRYRKPTGSCIPSYLYVHMYISVCPRRRSISCTGKVEVAQVSAGEVSTGQIS